MFCTRRVLFQLALASVAALVMVVISPSAWAQHNRHNGWDSHHGGGGFQQFHHPAPQRHWQHSNGGHHHGGGFNPGAAIGLGILSFSLGMALEQQMQMPQPKICDVWAQDGSYLGQAICPPALQ